MALIHPEFFDLRAFPWARELEKHWQGIRDEADAIPAGEYAPWPRQEGCLNGWNLFSFFSPSHREEEHCQRCPETLRLVDMIPGIQMATFSWLPPGARIHPHAGFSPTVLRAHLALKVPDGANETTCALRVGETTRTWEEGKVMVFDDLHDHEAFNHTDQARVVLMLDFLRPWKFRTSALGYVRQRIAPEASYRRSYTRIVG